MNVKTQRDKSVSVCPTTNITIYHIWSKHTDSNSSYEIRTRKMWETHREWGRGLVGVTYYLI